MTDIGTAPWIERQHDRIAQIDVDPALRLVVEQTVTGDPPTTWHIVIADGGASIVAGPHPAPDVGVTADPETVRAITRGEISAQRAFLDGQLRIGGDITMLLAAHDVITL